MIVLHVNQIMRAMTLAVIPIILVSCGGNTGPKIQNQKKTVPVHGQVFLDGQPALGVKVILDPKDAQTPSGSQAQVAEDGNFQISTYGSGDGAPAGEYALTFTYQDPKFPVRISNADEPDDFKGKYANPKTSKHSVSVKESDADIDVGRIDLKK